MDNEPILSWSRLVAFMRQHAHDVRNHLNGLDLEAALLADCVSDAEGQESVARLRAQIRRMAGEMKMLSARFAAPEITPAPLAAREVFLIWQEQLDALEARPEVTWQDDLGDANVSVDASALAGVLRELLVNARDHAPNARLSARGFVADGQAVFELREGAAEPVSPEHWGSEPFVTTRRGGYGLGLFAAQRMVDAHGGRLTRQFLPETRELVTQLVLPLV